MLTGIKTSNFYILFFFLFILFSAVHSQSPLDSLHILADSLFEKQDFDSAIKIYKSILKTEKKNIRALKGLGRIAIKENDWGDGKKYFKTVLNINPSDKEPFYYLGICYRETGKFKALLLRKLDWDKSEKYFNKLIAIDSLFLDVYFQLAKLKRYQEKYREAIALCHRQIKLKPDLKKPQIQIFRFYRYFLVNEMEEKAIAWLKLQPWDQAKFAIGEKLRREEKTDQADSIFQKLLSEPINMPEQPILLALARIHYAKNENELAENYFWRAVEEIENQTEADLIFEDLKYIFTDKELKSYRLPQSAREKKVFFHTFWTKRDPTPASKINYRLKEHYSRLMYAEKNFEFSGFRTWFNNPDQMGYFEFNKVYELNNEFNDKGLIYIRHGEADEWAKTGGMDVPENESWLYYETQNNARMTFHFKTENSIDNWRFASSITHPAILEDRLSWDNIYYRLYRADHLERQSIMNEMAEQFKNSVSTGIKTDRHTWEKTIKHLPTPFSTATFRGNNGRTKLEIYYAISLAPLADKKTNKTVKRKIETGISLFDMSWQKIVEERNEAFAPISIEEFAIDYYRFEVLPDSYRVSFHARPYQSQFLGGWRIPLKVEDYSTSSLSLSDIQMASFISSTEPGSKFNKNDLLVLPNPTKTYLRKKPVYLYFEIYNLSKNEGGGTDFSIDYTISHLKEENKTVGNLFGFLGNAGKSSISTAINREGNSEMSVEYLAIDVSKVKAGNHELIVKIKDNISGLAVKKKTDLKLK